MKVADLMSYQPVIADAYETVQSAAQHMRAHVVGALPVVDRGQLVGIVTDRDLALRVVAPGERPWETYVREVMSRAPATCRADEELDVAVGRMLARRERRLVVVDEGNAVRGMLSVDDLVFIDETRRMALDVLERIAAMRGELDGTFAEMQP
ncbi:MAG TPA: CBS domain-containing protein [Polyangia bacterium]